jgi:transposase
MQFITLFGTLTRQHFDSIRYGSGIIWADSGYNAHQADAAAAKVPPLRIEIVKRSGGMKGFVLLPRRWAVERTFSWFGRNRRLAKDWENPAATLQAFAALASIQIAIRRLAR